MRRFLALPLLLAACAEGPADDEHSHDDVGAKFEQAWLGKDEEKADGQSCSGVRVPDRGGFGGRVALTFDDGPNPATTPDVIAVLRRHQIPATFFINGSRVSDDTTRALVAEMAQDPLFLVGNHTWSHPDMADLTSSAAASQIDRTTDVIAAGGATPRWFRFPFGSSTCSTAQAVRDRGYTIAGWHVDSADWCFAAGGGSCPRSTFRYVPDALRNDMRALVLTQVDAYDGGVVLFHDVHRNTADRLEGIILALKDAGYTFARLDDASAFPLLNGTTPRPQPFVGHKCTQDADCAFESDGARGFCHRAGFCSLPCEGYCPDRGGEVGTFCVADTGVAPATGICVSQATPANGHCADLPGTIDASAERFIGSSQATAREAEACIPAPAQ